MEIDIFGKADCVKCEAAKEMIKSLLSEGELTKKIKVRYYDMESMDGMAEGAFNDVLDIPTIIFKDKDKKIARWDGHAPTINEMRAYLGSII